MVWVAVFLRSLLFATSETFLKMGIVCFLRTVSIPSYFASMWKETIPMPFGLKWGHWIEGVLGLVINSSFGRMIFHIMFYKNTIPFSVNHNLISSYIALSDTIVGHFWVSNLLRTCRVIKVTIPTYVWISC